MTPYQKLREENQKLRKQLFTVINQPDSEEAAWIRLHWQKIALYETAIYSGDATEEPTEFQGLFNREGEVAHG